MSENDKTFAPREHIRGDAGEMNTLPGAQEEKADGIFSVGTLLLGRYEVLGELGRGGMGIVYRCLEKVSGTEVAVKTLSPELSKSGWEMEQIRKNFQIVHALHHPYIANYNALELDKARGSYYLVMEYIAGEELRYYLRRLHQEERFSEKEIVKLITQAAEAIDYAHNKRILHRDIKPANLMVDQSGSVKVLDFGLAAQIHSTLSRVTNSAASDTCGTLSYMAPEQCRGRSIDERADQYAFAATVYEMFAGVPPFDNPDREILRQCVLNETPAPLRGVSAPLAAAVAKALSKNPAERFESCSAFAAACAGEMNLETQHIHYEETLRKAEEEVRHTVDELSAEIEILVDKAKKSKIKLSDEFVKQKTTAKYSIRRKDYQVAISHLLEAVEIGNRIIAEEEARRKAEEEARRKVEEGIQARRKAEEEARRKAEEEARRKAEEEARRKTQIWLDARKQGLKFSDDKTVLLECVNKGIQSVVIPEGVTEIGDNAFWWCRSLTSVTIPEGVTKIGYYAFSDCSSLTGVTIPASVNIVGEDAFKGVPCLEQLGKKYPHLFPEAAEEARRKAEEEEARRKAEEEKRRKVEEMSRILEKYRKAEEKKLGHGCSDQLKLFLPGNVELDMIRIKAGTFVMGSPANGAFTFKTPELGRAKDEVQHKVTLTEKFFIGKYPVTREQYKALTGKTPSHFEGSCLPVESVSWFDAKEFCAKLNAYYSGKLPPGYKFDLPSEAQWEYACRAGSTTALNSGKNLTSCEEKCLNLDSVAYYRKNSNNHPHPVGEKKANAWGVHDMHGNVWEWCLDNYGDYSGKATDPVGPENGEQRICRGGSFSNLGWTCRSACRNANLPTDKFINLGFRVALVPVMTPAEIEARQKASSEISADAVTAAEKDAEKCAEAWREAVLEEARCKAEEEARRKAEKEARRKAEEEARRKAEEEARRKAEEEVRRKAEEEACRKAEEEARCKAQIWLDARNQGLKFSDDKTVLLECVNKGIQSVVIPDGVTEIGFGAFRFCSSLTSVTIPEGVTKIGARAFYGCSSLTSVTIPEGVTKIGDYAFSYCSSLTSVTIPEGVTKIGESAFNGCSSLTSVTIPEGVTEIGSGAFDGCSSLTSVTIPEGVTKIGAWAFAHCRSLTSVDLPGSVESVGKEAFGDTPCEKELRKKYPRLFSFLRDLFT